jgi:hypothetical protein
MNDREISVPISAVVGETVESMPDSLTRWFVAMNKGVLRMLVRRRVKIMDTLCFMM